MFNSGDDDISFSIMQSDDFEATIRCCVCGSSDRIPNSVELLNELTKISSKRNDTIYLKQFNDISKKAITAHYELEHDTTSLDLKLARIKATIEQCRRNIKLNTTKSDASSEIQHKEQIKLTQVLVATREKESLLSQKASVLSDLQSRLREVTNVLYIERMRNAVSVFRMTPIVVSIPVGGKTGATLFASPNTTVTASAKPSTKSCVDTKQVLTGCSSILSIPLPNNGMYDDIPFECTATALAHIAHMTDSLAAALNINLPHPLMPFTSTECLISPQYDLTACYSLSPVVHINDRAIHSVFSWKTPAHIRDNQATVAVTSTHTALDGMQHNSTTATADTNSADKFLLNHAFTQALMLLQADVVCLCIRAGIPAECLWPPQAILLNLHELQSLCVKCVKRNTLVEPQLIASADSGRTSVSIDSTHLPLPCLMSAANATVDSDSLYSLRSRYASLGRDRHKNAGTTKVSLQGAATEDSAAWEGTADGEEEDYDMVMPENPQDGDVSGVLAEAS